MAEPSEIPVIVKAGFQGLKPWQKIAVVLGLIAVIGLSGISIFQGFEKVAQRAKYERLAKELDQKFEDDKQKWRNVVQAYQDSMTAAQEERQASINRFDTLLLEYQNLKTLHDEQKNIVADFDSSDRLNELGRISAAEGIK